MRTFLIVSPRVFDALCQAGLLVLAYDKRAFHGYGKHCDNTVDIECTLRSDECIEVHAEPKGGNRANG